MRGGDKRTGELFSYVDLEKRVRSDHPLRAIRGLVNEALVALEHEFSALYAPIGRPSIPPEKLLRAMLLQAFYSIRSERQLMERLEYDLLFRWFVGIGVDAAVWDHSVFSKNRDRLLEGDIAARFLAAVLDQPRVKKLLSTDHFTVDGTLIEAWASLKSFKPRDGSDEPPAGGGRNAEADFHGKKRSNETHVSTTDPDARLYRKGPGKEAKLCFIGHGLMENRHGLLVDACLTPADGHAERVAALAMIEPRADRPRAITLGADKAYDAEDFVNELRSMTVTPHVAQNTSGRSSAIDARTTRHGGYAVSQRIRKRIEEAFGWIKRRSYERYLALAQAQAQSGDMIGAENYYQHAEHYFRSMSSGRETTVGEFAASRRASSTPATLMPASDKLHRSEVTPMAYRGAARPQVTSIAE